MSNLNESIQAIRASLKKNATTSIPNIPTLENKLTTAELVSLHDWMLAERLSPAIFDTFKRVFGTNNKDLLIDFLAHIPWLEVELHKTLLNSLNDSELLILIERMLNEIKEHHERLTNLQQVLVLFCERLYDRQMANAKINQWWKETYAKQLSEYLMSNPICISHLAKTNSPLYSIATWSSPSSALKYRIDALLNKTELNPTKAKHYALIWLTHFSTNPEQLERIFENLNASKNNRTAHGEQNFTLIKQACWSLLSAEEYKEDELLSLFKLTKFSAIKTVVNGCFTNYHPYQQAHWLTLCIEPKVLNREQLLAILQHSLDEISKGNWEKASIWLTTQSLNEQWAFSQRMMQCSSHPLFNQKAYQLIIHSGILKNLCFFFKEQEFSWLLSYSRAEDHDNCLDLMQQCHIQRSLNLGLFFALMPADESKLYPILEKELFSNPAVMAQVFIELHSKYDAPLHLTCVNQRISTQDSSWLKQFLEQIISTENIRSINLNALLFINSLILNKRELFIAGAPNDVLLISNYLKELLELAMRAANKEHWNALRQITFQLLNAFMNHSAFWATLYNSTVVKNLILYYLPQKTLPPQLIDMHPLTDILLIPSANQLEQSIKQHAAMQGFIQTLLIQAPQRLDDRHFALLFEWLVPTNKIALSRALLSRRGYTKAQQYNIHLIVPFISQQEAFTLFTSCSQLAKINYGYNPNASNNEERLTLLTQKASDCIPVEILAECINSYVPCFTNQEQPTQLFFTVCEQFLNRVKSPIQLIELIDEQTISLLINCALEQPEHHTKLLEKLICSKHQKLCQQLLQLKLTQVLSPCTELAQLNSKQIQHFSDETIGIILGIQRLLYFATPIEALQSFIRETEFDIQYRKRLFCADASVYQALLNLRKSSAHPLDVWLSLANDYGQNTYHSYIELMEEWQKQKTPNHEVYFHWIRWKADFFSAVYQESHLAKELLHWLARHCKEELEFATHLKALLEHAAEQKELIKVLNYGIDHPYLLSNEHRTWLSKKSLQLASTERELVPTLIRLNSWVSLRPLMGTNSKQHFELIKIALAQPTYCNDINSSEEEQTQLLQILEHNKYSNQQIQELIQSITDKTMKSLLIIHLLSQASYLESLPGYSLLDNLAYKYTHQPSKLNGLVRLIQPTMLSANKINNLNIEAALAILCALTQFHQLSAHQVQLLLAKISQPTTIEYWLNHFAGMPNAHFILAHLLEAQESTVYTAFAKLSKSQQHRIRQCMIAHLELFNVENQILESYKQETLLIQALKLYLHGNLHPHYVQFITQLTEHLLKKNHFFSMQAIRLLIRLHDDQKFSELNKNTAYLVHLNLKIAAQSGTTDIFYDCGHPNIISMTQLIPVKPKLPDNNKNKSVFIPSPGKLNGPSEKNTVILSIRSHPLIETLTKDGCKSIRAFDYFLMHYQGNSEPLHKALLDYLGYFAQEPCTDSERRTRAIRNIATIMTRNAIDSYIKEVIYKSFLAYPNLYEQHISYCMFLFDAKRTIQYFGLRGNKEAYQQVIKLCNWALEKLDPELNKDIIACANTALFEARTELAFAEQQGFFARLFLYIQRCWAYGWTGFFKPKSPIYVAPLNNKKNKPQASSTAEQVTTSPQSIGKKDLKTLLEELTTDMSLDKLDSLVKELDEWQLKKQCDIEMHLQVHQFLHNLVLASSKDTSLAHWLKENQATLKNHCFYLLEHLLAQNQHKKIEALLHEIKEDFPDFHHLTQELSMTIPVPEPVTPFDKPLENTPIETKIGLLNTATTLVQNALNWTTTFTLFGKENESPRAAQTSVTVAP